MARGDGVGVVGLRPKNRAAVVRGPRGGAMAEEIRAEMVANVWKIVVSVGDAVGEGDTVAILESMKMEIPVVTEDGGTVKKIAVNEGDVVQEGDLIAIVDAARAAT
jgi:acetyl-CoA carboxylase biotin carboxyl carrier protein